MKPDRNSESPLDLFDRFVDKRLRDKQVDIERYVSKCRLSAKEKENLRKDLLRADAIINWQNKLLRDERRQEQERQALAAKLGEVRTDLSRIGDLFPHIPEELSRKLAELMEAAERKRKRAPAKRRKKSSK